MSEFGGLRKQENNQHALVPPKTKCGCPSGGRIKNGHIRRYPSYMEERGEKKRKEKPRHSASGSVFCCLAGLHDNVPDVATLRQGCTCCIGASWRPWHLKLNMSLSRKAGCTTTSQTDPPPRLHLLHRRQLATMALKIKYVTIPKGGLHGRSCHPVWDVSASGLSYPRLADPLPLPWQ